MKSLYIGRTAAEKRSPYNRAQDRADRRTNILVTTGACVCVCVCVCACACVRACVRARARRKSLARLR